MPVPGFNIPNFITLYQPPNYRLPKWLTYVQGLCGGLTWRKAIFNAYRNGDAQSVWNAATTYGVDAVVFWNFATYQSLPPGNINRQPDLNPDAWILRCASFIGASERVMYMGGVINLTWALNRQFGTTFRQPPWPSPYGGPPLTTPPPGTFSDIYITNSISQFSTIVSRTAPYILAISRTRPAGLVSRTIGTASSVSSYSFVVNVPIAVFNALGANDLIRKAIITRFVNKYCPSGITFSITTY